MIEMREAAKVPQKLEYGDTVIIWGGKKNRSFIITLQEGEILNTHLGVIAHEDVVHQVEGSKVSSSKGHHFWVFRPKTRELMMKVKRKTQIVYPKDAGWLILALDIVPGIRVLEMGTGSGAFTILLARLVGSEGKVYTFDRRRDFLLNALNNIKIAGLSHRVEARIHLAGEPFPVEDMDAVFLDLPNPWVAIPAAYDALAPGRPIALVVPNAEQLKKAVATLEENGFLSIQAVEVLERNILVRQQQGVRPFERMIGFTAYLVSARKAGD